MPANRSGLCSTPRCGRRAAKGRGGKCHTCRSRDWRAANPMRAAYVNLKAHAKERGKFFDLSFDDFRTFAIRLDYLDKRGRASDGFHIDRRDETKGYTPDNIRLLTNRENTKKYQEWKRSFVRDFHGKKWMNKKDAGL